MSHKLLKRVKIRKNRAMRNRKKLRGSSERPRMCVSKSINHIGVQIIDDENGVTMTSYSTQSKDASAAKKNKDGARLVGQKIAELAKQKNIEKVIFDRGRFKYHGLIAQLADAARENGLKF